MAKLSNKFGHQIMFKHRSCLSLSKISTIVICLPLFCDMISGPYRMSGWWFGTSILLFHWGFSSKWRTRQEFHHPTWRSHIVQYMGSSEFQYFMNLGWFVYSMTSSGRCYSIPQATNSAKKIIIPNWRSHILWCIDDHTFMEFHHPQRGHGRIIP